MSQCQACTGRAQLYLCVPCTSQLRGMLASLADGPYIETVGGRTKTGGAWRIERRSPGLLEDLADVMLGRIKLGGHSGGQRTRGSDTLPYEPDTDSGKSTRQAQAAILLDAIPNGLTTIVRDLCETRGEETPWLDAAGCARWLARHVGAIACDESAGHVHNEIARYVRRIERVVDRPARRIWLGPCPTWNEQRHKACATDLYAPEDAIEVYCRTCRATRNCNRLKLLQQNDIERKPLTWDKLLNANKWQPDDCRVPERTLQHWRKTGRLKPRGWLRPNGRHGSTQHHADDQPLYRWADVRRLRSEKPQRASTGAAARKQ